MRFGKAALAGLALGASLALVGQATGDDKEKRREPARRALIASEDPCQQVTGTLEVDPDADSTAFRGPFFLTYLEEGEALPIIVPIEGRDPLTIGQIRVVDKGTRIFIPEGAWVVVKKGSRPRFYAGFRPYRD
jgi:hypothetical protein